MKALKGIAKFWNDLPPAGKVIVLGGGAYAIYSLSQGKTPEAKTDQTVQDELQQQQQLNPATITDAQARLYADQLASVLLMANTEDADVYAVFNSLKNDSDFLKLVVSFGIRAYYDRSVPFYAPKLGDWNLAQWIKEDCEPEEVETINYILKQKNIKYRF